MSIVSRPPKLYAIFDQLPGPESCKFIELEDETGMSVGPSVGVEWSNKQYSDYVELGPFYSAKQIDEFMELKGLSFNE